jgi:uncharacterized protein YeaO (DUF488 family)
MITVKLSYSILNAWKMARFEDAIGSYLGKDIPQTPYLELGKLKHELWALHTLKTGTLAPELGGRKLINPIVEQKWQKIIPFNKQYQILIRGVIDLEDEEPGEYIITDYKCGVGKAGAHVDTWQLDMYKLLRPQATLGRIIAHNPYKCDAYCKKHKDEPHQCFGVGVKFLSDSNSQTALEYIYTYGGEIIQYLASNKLLRDYKLNGK